MHESVLPNQELSGAKFQLQVGGHGGRMLVL